jgi:phenylalanyl-tRNA synthetase beta chain
LPFSVDISYDYINRLLGEEISKNDIRFILDKLDIKIAKETETELSLSVPRYRNDVQRAADVCEEILRIYGYNRIPVAKKVNASINIAKEDSNERLMQSSSDFLSARGFHEIMSNSLSNLAYYEKLSEEVNPESIVHLANPGSSELSIMRRELIFGGLESIARNINHKQSDLKLYEYGKIYFKAGERDEAHPVNNHFEEKRLGIWLSGDFDAANWAQTGSKSDFYRLKSTLSAFLDAYGIDISSLKLNTLDSKLFDFGLEYKLKKQSLVRFGLVSKAIRKQIDIEQEVWYAEFRVDVLKTAIDKVKNRFKPLAKFPAVHRDLALLLDKSIRFEDLQQTAMQAERKYLKSMDLFDVYEGDGIEAEKKSYAVSFVLQDEEKTMNDKQIDKIMQKLLKSFEKDFDAKLR